MRTKGRIMGHALLVVVDRRKGAGLGMRIEVEWLWPSLTVGMRGRVVMGARAGHLWWRVAGCGGGGKTAHCGA